MPGSPIDKCLKYDTLSAGSKSIKLFDEFLIYAGDCHRVYFHADDGRSSKVYEYYTKCNMATRANLLFLVKRLADEGRIYDISKFRIENKKHKIYTFKAKSERFFCFFLKCKVVIVASAYRKHGRKVDRKELRRAIEIRKLYI